MDHILDNINRNYIALPIDEAEANNAILHELLDRIIDAMKAEDPLFDALYSDKFYGGSYWDGVKVTRPDEYDVHIQCKLDLYTQRLEPSNEPGWVNLKFQRYTYPNGYRISRRHPYYGMNGLHRLINNEDYLDTDKVMLWFHETLSKSSKFLDSYGHKSGKKRICHIITERHGTFRLTFRRHGPAFTFWVTGKVDGKTVNMNLDFVPCFVFPGSQYPTNGFQPNPVSYKPEIFIVAKPVKGNNKSTRYWRVSFQPQERELINDKQRLKPALRLMKKMRDKLRHECMASYFIKNVFLWEVEEEPPSFWNEPLSIVFMKVLKDYQEMIADHTISFFWYDSDNLISHVDRKLLNEISWKLSRVIADLEEHPTTPRVVAKYFLTRRELKSFLSTYAV
ncbi:hypothetical protein JTB14_030370 [Gonioctena quinquepunctata]|nr:hypothetical protein JTB14_030370 [Gonioctena quinquepunctata]